MRKANQEIKDIKILEDILMQSSICRLGLIDNALPYIVPFNYGYANKHIYIHCAPIGKKIDLLRENSRVSFEIEQKSDIVKNNSACKWSTAYRSIVGNGKVEILTDFHQKQRGLEIIMAHNGAPDLIHFETKQVDAILILKLCIESMTGKQSGNWNKIHNPESFDLKTERLILSEITVDDLPLIHQLNSIPEVDEFNTLGIPKTISETEKIFLPLINARLDSPRGTYTWKVMIKDTNGFIGMAGLNLSNNKFKLGEIYYKLHPDHWGKGYATEIAKRLIIAGFKDFNLQKVEAGVATENTKSIRVLERVGMTREGLRRKILPIRGEWKDNYHYAIVVSDERAY